MKDGFFDLISANPFYTINKIHESYNDDYINNKYYTQVLDNPHYLFLWNILFKIYKIFSQNQAIKLFYMLAQNIS